MNIVASRNGMDHSGQQDCNEHVFVVGLKRIEKSVIGAVGDLISDR